MTHEVNLDAVGRTALVTAAMRAAETSRPDAIHRDPYAATLAGELGPELLAELLAAAAPANAPDTPPGAQGSGAQEPGAQEADAQGSEKRNYNAIRTCFFDDFLRTAAEEPGMRQIVVAGAGMDARAYRMHWPDGVRYFEVDRPAVLDYKRERLAAVKPQADHRPVAVDLTSPSWPAALVDAGYEPDRPSAWLLEGLLFYIPEAGVHRVLDQVAELVAPGSRIAADVVELGRADDPEPARPARRVRELGLPVAVRLRRAGGAVRPARLQGRRGPTRRAGRRVRPLARTGAATRGAGRAPGVPRERPAALRPANRSPAAGRWSNRVTATRRWPNRSTTTGRRSGTTGRAGPVRPAA